MLSLMFIKTLLVYNSMVKVAVIDTGFDFHSTWNKVHPKICRDKTYNFFTLDKSMSGDNFHGTAIVGLVSQHAGIDSNYCIHIYKAIDKAKGRDYTAEAFSRALYDKVDVINYSAGGVSYVKRECEVIKKLLDRGVIINVAAGNNGKDLRLYNFWPAKCDPRINVLINLTEDGKINENSNYSTSKLYPTKAEVGTNLLTIVPNGDYQSLSGTSLSTAVYTGKIVKKLSLERRKKYIDFIR